MASRLGLLQKYLTSFDQALVRLIEYHKQKKISGILFGILIDSFSEVFWVIKFYLLTTQIKILKTIAWTNS